MLQGVRVKTVAGRAQRRTARRAPVAAKAAAPRPAQAAAATAATSLMAAAPSFAATEIASTAGMEVNALGLIAISLFVFVPVSFLIILYTQSTASGNASGGFSQAYYNDPSKNSQPSASLRGEGLGMRPRK